MNLYLFRLNFQGPVRFGASGIGLEETSLTLDSDGLASAFLNALAVQEGPAAVAGFINESLDGKPPAVFSSLFPFGPDADNPKATLYALPRPLAAPPAAPEVLRGLGKDLKKVRWLTPQDAARWLGEAELSKDELETITQYARKLARPWDDEARQGWFAEELRPRVALDRDTQSSNLWACAAVRFAPGAGLYGLVNLRDDWRDRWLGAMRLLGEMGLGGERTYGFGEFQIAGPESLDESWQPLLAGRSRRFLLLSTYFPASGEKPLLSEALEAWDAVERRGYVVSGRHATTLKRKRVRFLVPGSVFTRPLAGTFADVTPNNHTALGLAHRVYRCGLALHLPLP